MFTPQPVLSTHQLPPSCMTSHLEHNTQASMNSKMSTAKQPFTQSTPFQSRMVKRHSSREWALPC